MSLSYFIATSYEGLAEGLLALLIWVPACILTFVAFVLSCWKRTRPFVKRISRWGFILSLLALPFFIASSLAAQSGYLETLSFALPPLLVSGSILYCYSPDKEV